MSQTLSWHVEGDLSVLEDFEHRPTCEAQHRCERDASWFAVCPACNSHVPWCTECRDTWLRLAWFAGPGARSTHDGTVNRGCGTEHDAKDVEFIPIR